MFRVGECIVSEYGDGVAERVVGQRRQGVPPGAQVGEACEQLVDGRAALTGVPGALGQAPQPSYQSVELGRPLAGLSVAHAPIFQQGLSESGRLRHSDGQAKTCPGSCPMSMPQSEETHQSLLAKIPEATGRDVASWLHSLEQGPALLRFEERVNWLRDEHNLPHGYARAIVHEHDKRRAASRA